MIGGKKIGGGKMRREIFTTIPTIVVIGGKKSLAEEKCGEKKIRRKKFTTSL